MDAFSERKYYIKQYIHNIFQLNFRIQIKMIFNFRKNKKANQFNFNKNHFFSKNNVQKKV